MASCLHEIQSLNTLGVNHIDEGDFEEAAEVLLEAVSQLSFCSLAPTPLTPVVSESSSASSTRDSNHSMTLVSDMERAATTILPNRIHLEVAETPEEEPSAFKDDFYHYPFCFEKRASNQEGEDNEEDDAMEMEEMMAEYDQVQGQQDQETSQQQLPSTDTAGASASKSPQELRQQQQQQQQQLEELQRRIEASRQLEEAEDPLNIQEHGVCAATSLYNLALCYHLEYTKKQPHKTFLLQGALKYYQEAYNMILECQLQRNSALLQLIMAICTNAAHACYHSGQVHLVAFWNQQLCRILAFANPHLCHRFFALTAFHYKFDFTTAQAA